MTVALAVEGITKIFKMYNNPYLDRIKEIAFFWRRGKYWRDFYALDNVSFSLEKGEVIGMIGPNGAGKSTLLKIISGICLQTSGEVEVNGRLSAILQLGLGFNPRFTGRENILIGGMLLGMRLAEIRKKTDWIIDFSELGEYIEQPLRTYSAGMRARLSFSVAAAVSPDILIVDEVLATGDAYYVGKSLRRIHEICKQGTTCIFVSHNMLTVRNLCDRTILIDRGRIVKDGPTNEVVTLYESAVLRHFEEQIRKHTTAKPSIEPAAEDEFFGTQEIRITDFTVLDADSRQTHSLLTGDPMTLVIRYTSDVEDDNVRWVLGFYRMDGVLAYRARSESVLDAETGRLCGKNLQVRRGSGEIVLQFDPVLFSPGMYSLEFLLEPFGKDSNVYDPTRRYFLKKDIYVVNFIKPGWISVEAVFEHPLKFEHRQS